MTKNILQIVCLCLIAALTACKSSETKDEKEESKEDIAKETVEKFLKKQLKNPESFKIEFIEVKEDTIPFFVTSELLSLADDVNENMEELNRYNELGSLFYEEQSEARLKFFNSAAALKSAYDRAIIEKSSKELVAFVEYSGTNSLGNRVSQKSIVVVDRKKPKEVLGSYDIDDNFLKQLFAIKYIGSDNKFELKQNRYGKIETDGLSRFEQFVLDDAD